MWGYTDLETVKAALAITDADDDDYLSTCIEAAAQIVNAYTGRRFDLVTGTRYYDTTSGHTLYVPDLVSVTTLKSDEDGDGVFETTWAAGDYLLQPYYSTGNAAPYAVITRSHEGGYYFPKGLRVVEIAGTFGYSAVPDAVKWATTQLAIRLFKRKDAPFGVTGSLEFGQAIVIPKLDPDIVLALSGFRTGQVYIV